MRLVSRAKSTLLAAADRGGMERVGGARAGGTATARREATRAILWTGALGVARGMRAPRHGRATRASAAPATLEGQVADSVAGRIIEGVLVRIDMGPETFSDAEGRVRLVA